MGSPVFYISRSKSEWNKQRAAAAGFALAACTLSLLITRRTKLFGKKNFIRSLELTHADVFHNIYPSSSKFGDEFFMRELLALNEKGEKAKTNENASNIVS